MKRLNRILDRIERWGIFLCFSVSLVSLTIGILTRYVFRRPLSWPDELATYLFVLMTFLGASASVKANTELKVDAIYERFPSCGFGLDLLLHVMRLGACLVFIIAGYNVVMVEVEMQTFSPLLQIPVYLISAMLPFFGLLMALRTLECLVNLFARGR